MDTKGNHLCAITED